MSGISWIAGSLAGTGGTYFGAGASIDWKLDDAGAACGGGFIPTGFITGALAGFTGGFIPTGFITGPLAGFTGGFIPAGFIAGALGCAVVSIV